jgi:HD-GYP domain-containing protein (c-di-GMP phosphodiesterase class II)
MKALILNYPVTTLDGFELFVAGSELSEETIQQARKRHAPRSGEYAFFLKHGSVFNDMLDLMAQPPYSAIYAGPADRDTILALLKSCRVHPIVLASLDYFRRKDLYTYRHALMVFALSIMLARHLAVPGLDLEQEIIAAGPTHDIGKTCIPLPILTKGTALTAGERSYLEHHTTAGFALLAWAGGDVNAPAARIARDHHERSDGSGYPSRIELRDMLVEIIAACDIYDALVSMRPYRSASFDNRTALEELTDLADSNCLRREIIQALIALNRRSRPSAQTCVVSMERRGTPPAENLYGVTVPEPGAPAPHKS